jgi:hypothetical protein
VGQVFVSPLNMRDYLHNYFLKLLGQGLALILPLIHADTEDLPFTASLGRLP